MTGASSRARARTWPYPRHHHFEQALRQVAAAWFAEKGFVVSRRYPYILADRQQWPQNILLPEVSDYIRQQQAERVTQQKGFPLHKYIHHGLSSQAMLFNLIGPLVVSGDLEPLRQAFAGQCIDWPGVQLKAAFEYEDRAVFREDTGQPTSVDLVLSDQEGKPVFLIEAKLVETEFGGCSVFAAGDCDGRNPVDDLSQCYLHHLGRHYWTLLDRHDFLSGLMRDNATCLLASYYQFFREVLFALELGGTFVLLHDARNPTFACNAPQGQRGLMPLLRSFVPETLRHRVVVVTVQQVVAAIKASGDHPWINEFERKYGLS